MDSMDTQHQSKQLKRGTTQASTSPILIANLENSEESSPFTVKGKKVKSSIARKLSPQSTQAQKKKLKSMQTQIKILEEAQVTTQCTAKITLNNLKEEGLMLQELKKKVQDLAANPNLPSMEQGVQRDASSMVFYASFWAEVY